MTSVAGKEQGMLHIYEFEVFEDEGLVIALPFDMDGGTQGVDFSEACEMAADWLKTEMEHRAMRNLPFPNATFGNEPRHGGRTIIVAVDAGKETVSRMTAAAGAWRHARPRLADGEGRTSRVVRDGRPHVAQPRQRRSAQRRGAEGRPTPKSRRCITPCGPLPPFR